MRVPRISSTASALSRNTHPRSSNPRTRDLTSRSGSVRCLTSEGERRYFAGFFACGEKKSLDPRTKTPGTSSRPSKTSRTVGTMSAERLSPVLTTRSGSSLVRPATHAARCLCHEVRWRSATWRMRIGSAPAGSSGRVWRRTVKRWGSMPAPQMPAAAGTARAPATSARFFIRPSLGGRRRLSRRSSPACPRNPPTVQRGEAAVADDPADEVDEEGDRRDERADRDHG